ncbi:substrate-binding periplasmic protein [Undibacterium rugosum]|uniref:ABC transporter substrate-binding protein n=1 Tax=Undibacterium rugosum TaxID=2762291 RepID=A0A923I5G8_9BURK|nr:ABC transporter substrate-binding protein [Undibacterium rugosum]MBC3933928.1 ABC transporter substrate-binding protein [Undibacterium rugosum]MBR7777639.1 ABC transporter substrate-binding protein [Undibacterium rugosum]
MSIFRNVPALRRLTYSSLACCLALTTQISRAGNPADFLTLLVSEETDAYGKVIPLSEQHIQLFRSLSKEMQVQLLVQRYPWKRALEKAYQGEGMIFGISPTAERRSKLDFSQVVYTERVHLITRCQNHFRYEKLQDLANKRIGVVRGTSYGETVDQQMGKLFQVEQDTSRLSGRMTKLLQGRMDGFFHYSYLHPAALETSLNHYYFSEIQGQASQSEKLFCVQSKPISNVDIHFAIRHDINQDKLQKLDAALIKLKQSDAFQKMFSQ